MLMAFLQQCCLISIAAVLFLHWYCFDGVLLKQPCGCGGIVVVTALQQQHCSNIVVVMSLIGNSDVVAANNLFLVSFLIILKA